ncbi:MAG: hypothetical protein M3Z92_12170 [Bacteroidota bacterium]|nr:hypothetical protein [Bacteroidota bacterium]
MKTEIIEMVIENSFIEKLMIISESKEKAAEAAKKWCEENNCLLEYINSDLEQSSQSIDSRVVFYAKISPNNPR